MPKLIFLTTILISIMMSGVALAAPSPQTSEGEAYIVQADDWLSKIADKFYGDVLAYPAIVEATNAKAADDTSFVRINNPDVIEVGQKLWIPAQAPATDDAGLSLTALKNAQYQGIYEDEPSIQLTDGAYEGEPFVPGGASRPMVTFVDDAVTFGDLNGDGLGDAIVILLENSGGSGGFFYLAAVVNQAGEPVNVATQLIGDRVQINTITISQGDIILDAITHGPNDPLCCPTLPVSLTYRLEGDQLTEVLPQVAGIYKAYTIAASSPGIDSTFTLNAGQTLQLKSDYLNEQPPLVEVGTWEIDEYRRIVATITGQQDRAYDEPNIIPLTLKDNVLAVTPASLKEGELARSWVKLEALAREEAQLPYDAAVATQHVEEMGFVGIYKAFALSASCCGRDMTLSLNVDNSAQFQTDFHSDGAPIVEVGRWEAVANDRVTLTLTGKPDQPYPDPVVITFALIDGRLVAVEYDQSLYGSVGLTFYLGRALQRGWFEQAGE